MNGEIILSKKQLQDARIKLGRLDEAMTSDKILVRVAEGLPSEVVRQVTAVIKADRDDLADAIASYEEAKRSGSADGLVFSFIHLVPFSQASDALSSTPQPGPPGADSSGTGEHR